MEGWYYLHTNGDLIYKGAAYTSRADFHESSFVRAYWPFTPDDRENAWTILVEALAAGARPARVLELAETWGCDDGDGLVYASRVGVLVERVGSVRWQAGTGHAANIGEGTSVLEALTELALKLGYRPAKTWGASFPNLVHLAGAPA